ncbi:MAG: putative toxin-antitoxin system toxin component, PIN family [Anaerolinea sp.]|nr:putative toxin-antitoxin system toxin component, PIN family [Anaerolinea sp.]
MATDPESPKHNALRAVLDTHVVIAAHLSRNPRSPTIELLARWRAGEFVQLHSDDMLVELVEKFQARRIAPEASDFYLADLISIGEHVIVLPEQMPEAIAADSDDNAILACAFVGRATHLVTYDPHFDVLGAAYQGIPILDGLHFLYVVRGDKPPGDQGGI